MGSVFLFYMAVDKLQYSIGNSASTTLASGVTNIDTTASLTATTNFDDAPVSGEGMALFDEGLSTEELAYSTGLSGSALTIPLVNRGLEGGSAQAHTSSGTVRGPLTAGMWNNLITALTNVVLKTTGAVDTTKIVTPSGSQTLTNKTLTTPIIATISNTGTVTLPTATDTLVGRATTDTLTNKRRQPRVFTTADTATLTPEIDTYDLFNVTALTQAITIANHSTSTPANGEQMRIRLLDNGTARAISFGNAYVAKGGTALPTTTVLSKNLEMGFEYNSNLSKWNLLATAQEA